MGNCASEDTTNKGSCIRRRERMTKNPNEAYVVIDTNPILKKKEVDNAEANTSATDETIPFPKNGIKLSYLLNDFVDECGGKEALEGLTTTDVCDQFVKPKTKKYGLSYCDMILEKGKASAEVDGVVKTTTGLSYYDMIFEKVKTRTAEHDGIVNAATVYISHAWQYKFLDVLSALEDHFKDEPDKIIWFDLFSNNQHKVEAWELAYERFSTIFKDAIGQIGHTVMVMAPPWNDPIPYKRAWCIFEAYCTFVTDAKFEIAMSNNEHRAFIEEYKNCSFIIAKMLRNVNAEKSEASNPLDKERIHSVIRNEVRFTEVNFMIIQQLNGWVLEVALEELSRVKKDTLDELDLMYLVARLYKNQDRYDEAEASYKECLTKREKFLGSDHPDTLNVINGLAFIYLRQGKHGKAEQLFKECLEKRKTILGPDHPDTLQLMEYLRFLPKLKKLHKKKGWLCA